MIECKNWLWDQVDVHRIEKLKNSLPDLKRLAVQQGKELVVYFKDPAPESLKSCLKKRSIMFFEG